MKNNVAKRQALTILYQNRLRSLDNYEDLKRIIEAHQFILIEYKKHSNSKHVDELIHALGIQAHIEQNDAFIYCKNSLRFLFLNEEITPVDKCSLLRHELGHICDLCKNNSKNDSKIKKEEFANEFSCYLKNPGLLFKLFLLIIKKWKLLTCMFLLTSCIFGCYFIFARPAITATIARKNNEVTYYVTPAGKKYHKRNCIIVKYRTNLAEHTLDNAENLGYKPCKICILDK